VTNACAELVALTEKLAAEHPAPRVFLNEIGRQAAGIRRGPVGFIDLARGGRNIFPGDGVQLELDDQTGGQIRHFAGIVAASVRVSAPLTRWLSINIGRDGTHTPDGRLTDLATEFSSGVLAGEIAVPDAPAWIRSRLCG